MLDLVEMVEMVELVRSAPKDRFASRPEEKKEKKRGKGRWV